MRLSDLDEVEQRCKEKIADKVSSKLEMFATGAFSPNFDVARNFDDLKLLLKVQGAMDEVMDDLRRELDK